MIEPNPTDYEYYEDYEDACAMSLSDEDLILALAHFSGKRKFDPEQMQTALELVDQEFLQLVRRRMNQ